MRRRLMACAAMVGLLGGCGGGGGGSSGGGGGPTVSAPSSLPVGSVQLSAPLPELGSPTSYETAEYLRNWSLGDIHASSAYALGATGQGVTVAVIDTGVSPTNPDLASALSPDSADMVTRPPGDTGPVGQHGTWVASMLGARQNDSGTEGVAYGSTILSVRADTVGSCPTNTSGCSFLHSDLAAGTDYAVAHGARIINYSMGGTDPLDPVFQTALTNAVAAQKILVFAAGNTNGGDPLNPATFAATAASAGQAIAVGAVDQNNHIAAYSAQANATADHFMVAPGTNVVASGFNGTLTTVEGTSFAAPQVAGAAAVVLSAAPYLTSKQVVDLLLTTATPLGDPTIYGHGLLNLQGALSPQGTVMLPTGTSVTGTAAVASTTGLALGAAFGNAVANSTLIHSAMTLDAYGRAYSVDLSSAVHRPDTVPQLDSLLAAAPSHQTTIAPPGLGMVFHMESIDGTGDDKPRIATAGADLDLGEVGKLEFSQGSGLAGHLGLTALGRDESFISHDAFRSPYLAMAGQGSAVLLGKDLGGGQWMRFGYGGRSFGLGNPGDLPQGSQPQPSAEQPGLYDRLPQPSPDSPANHRQAFVGEYGFPIGGGARLALQGGALRERGSILDTQGQGGFDTGGGQATTRFAGLAASLPMTAKTDLFGTFAQGYTQASAPSGAMLGDFRGLASQSMGVGVTSRQVWRDDDRLTFSLSQPLRVTQGTGLLDLPVGRTMDGTVVRGQETLNLAPSGRELDAEMNYLLWLAGKQDLNFTALAESAPGHDSSAKPVGMLGLRYRLSW